VAQAVIISLRNAARYYRDEPHQIEAFDYLQGKVPANILEEFARLYRRKSIPESGIAIIKEFESCELSSYRDPLSGGLPITIGWGSTRRKDGRAFLLGETISQQEADDLLMEQIKEEFMPALKRIPFWSEMEEEMQGALLSFSYNLGARFYGSHGFQTITKCLQNKTWADVPNALLLYVNPGTKVTEGLRRRRKAEGDLWGKGLDKYLSKSKG
jgi:lysozyme